MTCPALRVSRPRRRSVGRRSTYAGLTFEAAAGKAGEDGIGDLYTVGLGPTLLCPSKRHTADLHGWSPPLETAKRSLSNTNPNIVQRNPSRLTAIRNESNGLEITNVEGRILSGDVR